MGEKRKPMKLEVETAAQALRTIRALLETVPMEMMEGVLKTSLDGRSRYQTLGPMMDPTDYQRHGADKERDFVTQIMSARALIDLKKAWRQDVPLEERIREEMKDERSIDERIQEELDRGAQKGADEEPEDEEWLAGRDARAGR